jgi:hypothetical protein
MRADCGSRHQQRPLILVIRVQQLKIESPVGPVRRGNRPRPPGAGLGGWIGSGTAFTLRRPPADAENLAVNEAAADELMKLLEECDGVVSAGTGSWDATVSVQATSAAEAVMSSAPQVEKLACKAGMPDWPLVRAEVVRQGRLNAANARPTLPELVSLPEAAEILGVSPQRVRELSANNAAFPAPMYELRTGRLWLKDAIDVFAQRWERKPGRPRRTQVSLPYNSSTALARMRATICSASASLTSVKSLVTSPCSAECSKGEGSHSKSRENISSVCPWLLSMRRRTVLGLILLESSSVIA